MHAPGRASVSVFVFDDEVELPEVLSLDTPEGSRKERNAGMPSWSLSFRECTIVSSIPVLGVQLVDRASVFSVEPMPQTPLSLRFALVLLPLALGACAPPPVLDGAVARNLLFEADHGVIAGIELGSSWKEIESSPPAGWELDRRTHSLRIPFPRPSTHLLRPSGSMSHVGVAYKLDDDTVVEAQLVIIGDSSDDLLVATELRNEIIEHLTEQVGPGERDSQDFVIWNQETRVFTLSWHEQELEGSGLQTAKNILEVNLGVEQKGG